jgi:4-hydroxy-3-polyprenylbenzoate decarboxylase
MDSEVVVRSLRRHATRRRRRLARPRGWLDLIEREGNLAIGAQVDPNEELAAVTFLASRQPDSPALLFENSSATQRARILANMFGEQRALRSRRPRSALGRRNDRNPHDHDLHHQAGTIPKEAAPVNEVIVTGDAIDLRQYPVPKFWPGDGGQFIGTGDITFTASPESGRINVGCYREMLHGPARIGMYCSPGKHGLLDREAWWARDEPCEVVAAFGIDPVLFMLGAQALAAEQSELDIAGGIMGRPIELTTAECVRLPIPAHAEFVIEGIVRAGNVTPEGPSVSSPATTGGAPPQPVIEVKASSPRPIFTHALMARYPPARSAPITRSRPAAFSRISGSVCQA